MERIAGHSKHQYEPVSNLMIIWAFNLLINIIIVTHEVNDEIV